MFPATRLRLPGAALLLALGLTLAQVPPAAAAPSEPPKSTLPQVWPQPKSMHAGPGRLTVPERVVAVVGRGTDPAARRVVETVLRDAGAKRIVTVAKPPAKAGFTVFLGGPKENIATASALKRLKASSPAGLPSGGYVLASGRGDGRTLLALSGTDRTGTFHAARTLRQLVTRTVPVVTVRDWPTAALRGVIEGFYGTVPRD